MPTKYEDCVSIAGTKVCKQLQEYERQTKRNKQIKADIEDDSGELILKAAYDRGMHWIPYVRQLTMEVLEIETTRLLVEQEQLKAELDELKEVAKRRGFTVKAESQIEPDWQAALRSITPPGMIW